MRIARRRHQARAGAGPPAFEPDVELSTAGLDALVEHNAGDLTASSRRACRWPRAQSAFARGRADARARPARRRRPPSAAIVATGDSGPLRSPLRRRARPRAGHARGAVRRHRRQGGRQGDQERGRLRPGQAVRRLVRHARRDRRGGGAPAPAPAGHGHGDRAHRATPATLAAARGRARPRAARAQRPRRALGGRRGRRARPLRRRRAAPAGGAARRACCARPGSTPSWSRRTTSSGAPSATASARPASPTRSCACPALQTELPALLAAAGAPWRCWWAAPPLGLSWLRLADPRRRAPSALARPPPASRARVVLDAPADVRERVDPWGPSDAAALALMRRVKERFDPAGACAPGVLGVSRLRRDPAAVARPDRRLRALRLLPADLPDLRALGRGDGLAARAHRADEAGPRGASCRAAMVEHLDNCLGCMACVTACPSGVQYDKLIEDTRAQVERNATRPAARARLPPARVRALPPPRPAARRWRPLIALAQRLRLDRAARRRAARAARAELATLLALLARRLGAARAARLPERFAGARRAARQRRAAPGLRAARVLRRRERGHGARCSPPRASTSTRPGAPALLRRAPAARRATRSARGARAARRSRRSRATTRRGQRRRLRLGDEGLRAPAARRRRTGPERAEAFAAKVRDVTELLAEHRAARAARPRCRCALAYHDACHLAHAQGVRAQPRAAAARRSRARAGRARRAGRSAAARPASTTCSSPSRRAELGRAQGARACSPPAPRPSRPPTPGCALQIAAHAGARRALPCTTRWSCWRARSRRECDAPEAGRSTIAGPPRSVRTRCSTDDALELARAPPPRVRRHAAASCSHGARSARPSSTRAARSTSAERRREGDWTVAPAPAGAAGPARRDHRARPSRKMVINALNSGARGFMADFEDANSPTWSNMVGGQVNLTDAVRGDDRARGGRQATTARRRARHAARAPARLAPARAPPRGGRRAGGRRARGLRAVRATTTRTSCSSAAPGPTSTCPSSSRTWRRGSGTTPSDRRGRARPRRAARSRPPS